MSESMSWWYFFLIVLAGLAPVYIPLGLTWLASRLKEVRAKKRRLEHPPYSIVVYLDCRSLREIKEERQSKKLNEQKHRQSQTPY